MLEDISYTTGQLICFCISSLYLIICLIAYLRHFLQSIVQNEHFIIGLSDFRFLQFLRGAGLLLCMVQLMIFAQLILNNDYFIFLSDVSTIISHTIIIFILFIILYHTMNVCNEIFTALQYINEHTHTHTHESNEKEDYTIGSPTNNSSLLYGNDNSENINSKRKKSISYSISLLTQEIVLAKYRNVYLLSFLIVTCFVNIALDVFLEFVLKHNDFNQIFVLICCIFTVITSLIILILLIVQFKSIYEFGKDIIKTKKYPKQRQINKLKSILKTVYLLYFLFCMELIYWIGFIIKTFVITKKYYDKYSFLFSITIFAPITVFHVLLLYYTKVNVINKPILQIQQHQPVLHLVYENDNDYIDNTNSIHTPITSNSNKYYE
eukprot:272534_1